MNSDITVLCVDDELNVLRALQRVFLDEGYRILTASSGLLGIEILSKEEVQIVISDYRMPGMNGVEFLKEVRKRWPDTVRIVLSGYADTVSVMWAINEGQIYKFIAKPWSDDALRTTVKDAVERHHLYKSNHTLEEELRKKNEEIAQLSSILQKLRERDIESFASGDRASAAYAHILNGMPVGVAAIDDQQGLILSNILWKEAFGDAASVPGETMQGLRLPIDMPELCREAREKGHAGKSLMVRGSRGRLMVSPTRAREERQSLILIFIRESDLA